MPAQTGPPHIRVFLIMPYPIPDNLDNIEGWRWYLVPLPDDDQMIQVAWGMWSELTHFWNWGKEGPIPEQSEKAAQLWAAALYEAWRIRDMGFPDLILTYIDEVEGLLRDIVNTDFCCSGYPGSDQIITDDPTEIETSDTNVGNEVFPAGITTEQEMRLYLCGAAHAFVDRLINAPERIAQVTSWGLASLTILILWYTGGAFLAIAGVGIGALFTVGNIFDALDAFNNLRDLLQSDNATTPTATESALLAARDDLICAIVDANTAGQAGSQIRGVIADLEISTAWKNVLFLMTSNPFLASIFNGNSRAAPLDDCGGCAFTPLIQIWDARRDQAVVTPQNFEYDTWYQIPTLPISGTNDWSRAIAEIRDSSGSPVNVIAQTRLAEGFCNGASAVSNPFSNSGSVRNTANEILYQQNPTTPAFAYTGTFSRVAATSNNYQSCSSWVIEIKVTGWP